MNRVRIVLCTACIALFALASAPAGGDPAIDMLEDARAKMKELAEKDLPNKDLGKKTQDKEEVIIQTLEDLIQMILDEQAKQQQQSKQTPSIGGEKLGNVIIDTPTKPGGLKEGITDTAAPSKERGEEWGQDQTKEFDKTSRGSDVKGIPGYEKIVERYRAVKAENQNKVDE